MTEKHKIWTPPEKLDPNVQRYAWLLFMECWKGLITNNEHSILNLAKGEGIKQEVVASIYGQCLDCARTLRRLEEEPPRDG